MLLRDTSKVSVTAAMSYEWFFLRRLSMDTLANKSMDQDDLSVLADHRIAFVVPSKRPKKTIVANVIECLLKKGTWFSIQKDCWIAVSPPSAIMFLTPSAAPSFASAIGD